MLKSFKGITLIALVVTIVVLLILAGVAISTLTGENRLITQAQKAKEETEKASEEELRKLTQMEANTSLTNREYKDRNGDKAIIPAGFAVSQIAGENTIKDGLVVVDKKGNEFVWVPIELSEEEISEGITFESKYPRTRFRNNEPTNELEERYKEPYDNGYMGENIEYENMINSVTKYKGFYVGRYEAGFLGTTSKSNYFIVSKELKPTQEQINNETSKIVIQRGAQIYTFVPWGASTNDITATNVSTTDIPEYVIGAVELSKNFSVVNEYADISTNLIYGIQWDAIMRFVSDDTHNVNDSSNWGNYSNSIDDAQKDSGILQVSGKNTSWKAKNIYDLAGNVSEWTMEGNENNMRIYRGGGVDFTRTIWLCLIQK